MASQDTVVRFMFELQDDVSGQLQQMGNTITQVDSNVSQFGVDADLAGSSLDQFGNAASNTTSKLDTLRPAFRANSQAVAQFSSQIAIAASSVGQLANAFGLVPESMQKTVSTTLAVISATSSLISVIASLNQIERVHIILSSIRRALEGPRGIAILVSALALGAVAAAAVAQFRQTSPGQQQVIPGSSAESSLAIVHGGEIIGRPSTPSGGGLTGGGGTTVIIQAGTIVADEGGMRALERSLARVRGDEQFSRGTTI